MADLVDLFFTIDRSQIAKEEENTELIVPDGTLGLLFIQSGHLQRSHLTGKKEVLSGNYFFGQKTRSVTYHFNRTELKAFGVKLKPLASVELFGVSPEELTDNLLPVRTVLHQQISELEQQIAAAVNASSQVQYLESFIQKNRRPTGDRAHLLGAILRHITQVRGNTSVKALAEHFQLGYKALERLFKTYVGLTPKQFCRIIRFNATIFYQEQRHFQTLTDIAYRAGYFDQMHFIKEVKAITDLSPTQFYASGGEEIAALQRRHIAAKYELI